MSSETEKTGSQASDVSCGWFPPHAGQLLQGEFQHVRSTWWCFFALGVLLILCGTTAIIYPVLSSLAAVVVLGVLLMVSGVASIIGAFWAGKWSGFLLELLVGILYLGAGMVVRNHPLLSVLTMTVFVAVSFIVIGMFRTLAALLIRFPQWGWALLNGVVTLLCGIIVYQQLPAEAFWVVGLLIGLEMLFNGWKWVMLSLAIRSIPKVA